MWMDQVVFVRGTAVTWRRYPVARRRVRGVDWLV